MPCFSEQVKHRASPLARLNLGQLMLGEEWSSGLAELRALHTELCRAGAAARARSGGGGGGGGYGTAVGAQEEEAMLKQLERLLGACERWMPPRSRPNRTCVPARPWHEPHIDFLWPLAGGT